MDTEYEDSHSKTINDYIAILKRRKKAVLLTALSILFIGIITTLLWPSTYRSTAVILIEEQDVPQELVRSTITSYAVQRIQEIKQRIMTTNNIMSIAKRFELYTEKEFDKLTRSEITSSFRSNVSIQPISAEVIDPRSGRPTEAVIAFSLSFTGKRVDTVHKVTNELVTLYLSENLKERTAQSNSTSDFLSSEVSALDTELNELEQKISFFKESNKGSLPELNSFNLSIVDRSQQELLDILTRIQELDRRKIQLQSQLSQLSPSAPQILPSGESVMSDPDRLKALQSEYRKKAAIYRDDHPDLKRLDREITSLEAALGQGNKPEDIAKELQVAKNQLASYQDKYTEEHPSLIKQKNLVTELEKELSVSVSRVNNTIPDNPAYVLLDTQLESINSEIASLQSKEYALRDRITKYDSLLTKMPAVEKDYQALLRDYENTQLKYREIKAKQTEAELSRNLEQERKGERFTLIQPPEIPEKPVSPNRALLFIMSFVLSTGMGAGIAILRENLDPKVYGEKSIIATTNIAPIGVIPYMEDESEKKSRKKAYIILSIGLLVISILTVFLFHSFVKPLDVTWFILLRKLGIN